jgi:hypothetical protein
VWRPPLVRGGMRQRSHLGLRIASTPEGQKARDRHICPEVVTEGYRSLSLPVPPVDSHLADQQDKYTVKIQQGGCWRHQDGLERGLY